MFVIGLTDSGYHLVGQYSQNALADLAISANKVSSTAPDNAVLGILTAGERTHTYMLSNGAGDTNNSAVAIHAINGTVTIYSPSSLGVGVYTFRVTATDELNDSITEIITFSVVEPGSASPYGFNITSNFSTRL